MKLLLQDASKHREQWLELRANGITASEVPTVLGLNPWKSRYSLWQDKIKAREGIFEDIDNEAMFWGRQLEEPIAQALQERHGMDLYAPDALFGHDDLPLLATPDRLDRVSAFPVEIKTTSERHREQWESGLADNAHAQLATQMLVLDAPTGFAAALVGGQKLFLHQIERDAVLDQQIAQAVVEFWQLVETKTPPALDAADLAAVKDAYPEVTDETRELQPEHESLIVSLQEAKAEIARLGKRKEQLEAELLDWLGNAGKARSSRWEVVRSARNRASYVVKASSFIEMRIKELKP